MKFSYRLLAIDDNPDLRSIIQLCLQKTEQWLVTATSSRDMFLHTSRIYWDAILLEIALCEENGFAVFDRLQADPITQSIPIILLTSKVMAGDRLRYQQMNIAGVISKPFHPMKLGQQITETLAWDTHPSTD